MGGGQWGLWGVVWKGLVKWPVLEKCPESFSLSLFHIVVQLCILFEAASHFDLFEWIVFFLKGLIREG